MHKAKIRTPNKCKGNNSNVTKTTAFNETSHECYEFGGIEKNHKNEGFHKLLYIYIGLPKKE